MNRKRRATSSKTALAKAIEDAMAVQPMGGRVHVHWDETARATPHGQLVFFAGFLATAGVFDRLADEFDMRPNAWPSFLRFWSRSTERK